MHKGKFILVQLLALMHWNKWNPRSKR